VLSGACTCGCLVPLLLTVHGPAVDVECSVPAAGPGSNPLFDVLAAEFQRHRVGTFDVVEGAGSLQTPVYPH
jgi:hypothetical protein